MPDEVEKITATPVIYFKTLRAGKAVANRFVERYLDSYGFGLILHPTLKKDVFPDNEGTTEFVENSLDYTTIIPLLSFPERELYPLSRHSFEVTIDYKEAYPPFLFPTMDEIKEKIALISHYCSLRIGDFITHELSNGVELKIGQRIIGKVDGTEIFNLKIK